MSLSASACLCLSLCLCLCLCLRLCLCLYLCLSLSLPLPLCPSLLLTYTLLYHVWCGGTCMPHSSPVTVSVSVSSICILVTTRKAAAASSSWIALSSCPFLPAALSQPASRSASRQAGAACCMAAWLHGCMAAWMGGWLAVQETQGRTQVSVFSVGAGPDKGGRVW